MNTPTTEDLQRRVNRSHFFELARLRGYSSNRQLAQELGIQASLVADIRAGRATPSRKLLQKICDVLDTSASRLCLLDRNIFDRIPASPRNDYKPGDTLASPAIKQEPVAPISAPVVDEMDKANAFVNEAIAKALNGRTISDELRTALADGFRGRYWLGYSPDETAESILFLHSTAIEAEALEAARQPIAETTKASTESQPETPAIDDDTTVDIPEVLDQEAA